MIKMTLKERIKMIINDQCDRSNKRFAKKIGISPSTILIWDDEHLPKGDILTRIWKEFNVNINWLLTGQGEPYIYKDRAPAQVGPHQIVDKDGLWGKGRRLKKEGVDFNVTEYGGQEVPTKEDHDFGRASNGLYEIYESRDPILIPAIEANIRAFQLSVRRERQNQHQAREIKALKKECDELKERLTDMEEAIRELKKGQAA